MNAASPPADAPMPTTGKAVSVLGWRGGVAPRLLCLRGRPATAPRSRLDLAFFSTITQSDSGFRSSSAYGPAGYCGQLESPLPIRRFLQPSQTLLPHGWQSAGRLNKPYEER